MALSVGHKPGPYEILSLLGAGGVGDVFRPRDTKLGRGVAVKVPLPHLAEDPVARGRLWREAMAAEANVIWRRSR